ncbi:DMT family transporter [Acinetobacter sp.]|uniref:DMT family transporter n=1 Tax=Acinetobacter sp. TaxID=472 RepID=UPI0035B176C2
MHDSTSNIRTALFLLTISAFLFATMGVLIRLASHTVDNAAIVFFRNAIGLIFIFPLVIRSGFQNLKTQKLWMHTWRAVIGLIAMYGFFYAIAHMKLSNAMVFTYSSPIFIPLVAWLFLKERITSWMLITSILGMIGVIFVAKPDSGLFNTLSAIGITASFCAAMAFVTVRALTRTEPPVRIVFYFCLIATIISAVPMFWHWRAFDIMEMIYLVGAGVLATTSQLCMSHAYKLAPAGQIGPANYLAIIFAGIWAAILWQEYPDMFNLIGFSLIFIALLMCSPQIQRKVQRLFS